MDISLGMEAQMEDILTLTPLHDRPPSPMHMTAQTRVAESYPNRLILCLPSEIATRVFAYLLPITLAIDDILDAMERESDWKLHRERKHDDLLSVSQVCREWRRICLSTSLLWRLLWITDDDVCPLRAKVFTIGRSRSYSKQNVKQRLASYCDACYGDVYKAFNGPLFHPNFADEQALS